MVNIPHSLIPRIRNMFQSCYTDSFYDFDGNFSGNVIFRDIYYPEERYPIYIPYFLADKFFNNQFVFEPDKQLHVVHKFDLYNTLETKTTSNAILSKLMSYNYTHTLFSVRLNLDIIYYGNQFCILKKEDGVIRPLMISAISLNPEEESTRKTVLLVDRNVFINEDMISKYIVKKVIPYLLEGYLCRNIMVKDLSENIMLVDSQSRYNKNAIYKNISLFRQ